MADPAYDQSASGLAARFAAPERWGPRRPGVHAACRRRRRGQSPATAAQAQCAGGAHRAHRGEGQGLQSPKRFVLTGADRVVFVALYCLVPGVMDAVLKEARHLDQFHFSRRNRLGEATSWPFPRVLFFHHRSDCAATSSCTRQHIGGRYRRKSFDGTHPSSHCAPTATFRFRFAVVAVITGTDGCVCKLRLCGGV